MNYLDSAGTGQTGFPLPGFLKDIRLYLALAFILRLVGITNPPLETSHHWRQTSVTMVARNLERDDFDLLHPKMDTAGERSGITGMEFPILNAAIALCIRLFGQAHWYGRLIVLLVTTVGTWFYFDLVKRRLGPRPAFFATLVLLVSLWFMYGRKIMPDVMALSFVIMGISMVDRALQGVRFILKGLAGALLIGVGLLVKITAGCLLAVLLLFIWERRRERVTWICCGLVAVALCPVIWWYYYWVPHLVQRYGYWHFFMGKSMLVGLNELLANLPRTLDNFYFDALRFTGFAAFLFGVYVALRRWMKSLLAAAALLSIGFAVTMLKAGSTFWGHAYYVLPFIPTMALFVGIGLTNLRPRFAYLAIVAISAEGLLSQANDFRISNEQAFLLRFEAKVRSVVPENDLVAINSGEVPTPMYFANCRGWTLFNSEMDSEVKLDSLNKLGCRHVIVLKRTYEGNMELPWRVVLETEDYRIYSR